VTEDEKADSVKDWVLKELVSKKEEDQSVVASILAEQKDKVGNLFSIREDGRVTVKAHSAPAQDQILSYLLGAAYARIAELRDSDGVTVSELTQELAVNQNTLAVSVKRLRDRGDINRVSEGIYRIEYRNIKNVMPGLMGLARQPADSKRTSSLPKKSVKTEKNLEKVFRILNKSGVEGLTEYLISLNESQLKEIIKDNRLDPAGNSLSWHEKEKLVDLITKRLSSRSRHGDVFLGEQLAKQAKEREIPRQAMSESLVLPSKGKLGLLEFSKGDVRFPQSSYGRLTYEEAIGLLLCEVEAPLTPADITFLISRGFKKIDPRNTRTYLTGNRFKLKKFVIREGEGYRLTNEGLNWIRSEVVPKLQENGPLS
jgi:uncharacterized protein YjhX (UPF0386 family)